MGALLLGAFVGLDGLWFFGPDCPLGGFDPDSGLDIESCFDPDLEPGLLFLALGLEFEP